MQRRRGGKQPRVRAAKPTRSADPASSAHRCPWSKCDDVRTKLQNRICDPDFTLICCRPRQPHVMTSSLRSSSDAGEADRQGSSEFARFLCGGDEQDSPLLTLESTPNTQCQSKRDIQTGIRRITPKSSKVSEMQRYTRLSKATC